MQPSPETEQPETMSRLRSFVSDLFERVFGHEHPGRHDPAPTPDDEAEIVKNGVNIVPDSWRDL